MAFIVDHDPPAVKVTPPKDGAAIALKDELDPSGQGRLRTRRRALGADFPDDGLFDHRDEKITLSLPDLKPGSHLVMVRATDSAGNLGTGDALIKVGK